MKAALNKTKKNSTDDYIWIASDGWAQFDTDPGLSKQHSFVFLRRNRRHITDFNVYLILLFDIVRSNRSNHFAVFANIKGIL